MSKQSFKSSYIFIFLSFVFIVIITYLYFESNNAFEKSRDETYKIEKNRTFLLSKNIFKTLDKETSGNIEILFKNNTVRKRIEKILSYYANNEFKYIYLIYIDKKGAYRYLADGSNGMDKGEYKQKYTPMMRESWNELIKTKKPQYNFKQKADGLWMSYIEPIVQNGSIKAILVMDISTKAYQSFIDILQPFNKFLKVLLFISFVIIFTILLLNYLFFRLRKQSLIDPLTKLYNRNYLNQISSNINMKNMTIMMLDIDHFKRVNDTYGHEAGDIVLSWVAKKILIATRLDDKVIRFGGEEFVVLANSHKNEQCDSLLIAKRIKYSISQDSIRISENKNINITISIGVNPRPYKQKTLKDAIKVADKMLYLAKESGRNKIKISKEDICEN